MPYSHVNYLWDDAKASQLDPVARLVYRSNSENFSSLYQDELIGLSANITDRASIRAMLDQVAMAYGGFDHICVTAGIFVPSDTEGNIPDDKWALTFNINVTGSYFVASEAYKTWKAQGLRGNLVLTTSANAAVAKKGSVAYDTSKAAANQLTRELAIEMSPLVRVNAVAPATVAQGSAISRASASSGRWRNTKSPTRTTRKPSRSSTSWPNSTPTARLPRDPSRPPIRPRLTSSWSRIASARPPGRSSPWTAACKKPFSARFARGKGAEGILAWMPPPCAAKQARKF
jgi:NAD(P)-dependent dehydrogenase (short-subunit alcohol dehydrogenase family)